MNLYQILPNVIVNLDKLTSVSLTDNEPEKQARYGYATANFGHERVKLDKASTEQFIKMLRSLTQQGLSLTH